MNNEKFKFFLGLVADHQRAIRPGTEYNKYFPAAKANDEVIDRDGSVKDTVGYMADMVSKYGYQCKQIAQVLKGPTLEATLRNVWNFCYHHIQYKLDKDGVEQLRQPARSWADRETGVDCDCYSIFVGSILHQLGINFKFRVTKYTAGWQHVYIVVPKKDRGHYTIDCVLNQFDYEKPFTDKFDYDMEKHTLSGIPIEMLSGLGSDRYDADLLSILNGTDISDAYNMAGIGAAAPQGNPELVGIYNHLVKTRDYLKKNPTSIMFVPGGANKYVQGLDHAIKYWNTPFRDAALDELEAAEEKFDSEGAGVSGLGKVGQKFFSKVKEAVKNVANGVKNAVKDVVHAVVKYNPVSLAVRGSYLLAMKTNLFGMAKHLYPGAVGSWKQGDPYSDADYKKSVAAYAKVKHLFTNVLQGKEKNLKDAITEGRAKKKYEGVDGLGALGVVGILAELAVAAPPIIETGKALDDAGIEDADKVKFAQKIANFFKKVGGKIKNVFQKKNPASNDGGGPDANSPTVDFNPDGSGENEDTNTTTDTEGDGGGNGTSRTGGFMFWVKDNPIKAGLIALAAAGGITLAVSPGARNAVKSLFGGKKQSLSGIKVYQRGHKRKKDSRMLPKGSHVKSIALKG